MHTSTASVAILPQAEEVDVVIRDDDLRIDTMRASGAGWGNGTFRDGKRQAVHIIYSFFSFSFLVTFLFFSGEGGGGGLWGCRRGAHLANLCKRKKKTGGQTCFFQVVGTQGVVYSPHSFLKLKTRLFQAFHYRCMTV